MQSILILDDDYAFRGLVRDLLKSKGLEVIEASSGQEASAAISNSRPILAIVDYRLPDTDGLSWITKLREGGNSCPLVFCSQTWCDPKTFNWLRNILKASLILQKPIVPELFLSQLENLLPAKVLQDVINEQTNKTDREQRIEKAKIEYAKGLGHTWGELSKAISKLQQNPTDREALEQSISWAHRIAGTAGSLGFHRIGDLARTIQSLLRTLDPSDTMQKVVWSEIFRSMAEGETAVRNSVRLCETIQDKESLTVSRILLLGKEGYYKDNVHKLQTTMPVAIKVSESVEAASERIKTYNFDSVIFDLSVDDNSKILQLAKEIRLLPGYESLPFGFISKSSLGFMSTSLNNPIEVDLIYSGCSILLSEIPKKAEIEQACNKLLSFRQANQPRILTVDDDELLTQYIAGVLTEENMRVLPLNSPIEIMDTLDQFQPDLVLLDVMMPGLSGYDVCRQIRSADQWQDLPIIFLTAKNDQGGRAAAFRAGGSDFLSKPILAEELIMRVKSQLELPKQKIKASQKEQRMGVLSRDDFFSVSKSAISNAGKDTPSCVVLVTIDDFTEIGFTHGMDSAQEAVLCLKSLVQCRFRAEDIKGCLGESMFAITFTGHSESMISKVMGKLQEEYATLEFTSGKGSHFEASVSFGIAQYPVDGTTFELLIDTTNRRLLANRKLKPGAAAFVS